MPYRIPQAFISFALTYLCLALGTVSASGADHTPPAECQQLASYFHHQALLFRAKAQTVLDQYVALSARYPMVTKTVSRAEITQKSYKSYLIRAGKSARLAEQYDGKSTVVKSGTDYTDVVSLEQLLNEEIERKRLAFLSRHH